MLAHVFPRPPTPPFFVVAPLRFNVGGLFWSGLEEFCIAPVAAVRARRVLTRVSFCAINTEAPCPTGQPPPPGVDRVLSDQCACADNIFGASSDTGEIYDQMAKGVVESCMGGIHGATQGLGVTHGVTHRGYPEGYP